MADIQHAIQISATGEQVKRLVSTAGGLGEWWATDITEAGGTVELSFFNRTTIYRLRPVADPASGRAQWVCESGDEWGGTRLSFDWATTGASTLLLFAHEGWRAPSDYFRSCNTTWGELMFRLKAAAEGKKPGPLFTREGWVA